MKIALIGTRGIPARHGGFETCVEEVGSRLVLKGHAVTVYSKYVSGTERLTQYKGMNIVYIPRVNIKGLETLFSTFLSVIHTFFHQIDFCMVFNAANSPALLPYKLFGKKFALNTDGLEWQRDKWGFRGKNYYKMSERIAVLLCKNLVSDSVALHTYYKEKYGVSSTIIAYGATPPPEYDAVKTAAVLSELGLKKGGYFLQVTRFEPENNPLISIKAIIESGVEAKMVVVGGACYQTDYAEAINSIAASSQKIVLPGFIYDKERLEILWKNALGYIHGNGVGGTNPALLQAMAAGRPVLSLDCIFNRETLGECGYYFSRTVQSLTETIRRVVAETDEAEKMAVKAIERVKEFYTWEQVTDKYEALFEGVLNKKS